MSLRPRAHIDAASDIRAQIDQARIAHQSFLQMRQREAAIEAVPTWFETGTEIFSPWMLEFKQTGVEGKYGKPGTVMHTIKISGGPSSRLRGVTDALKAALEPVYTKNGWVISQPGNVFKVCTDPSKSFGEMGFKISGVVSEVGEWVVPAGLPTPAAAIRAIFGIPSDANTVVVAIDDVEYVITPYAEIMGEMASFQLKRASYVEDRPSLSAR